MKNKPQMTAPSLRRKNYWILGLLPGLAAAVQEGPAQTDFLYVNYSATVPAQDLAAYDVLILSPDAFDVLPEKVRPGQRRLGYLSVGEIAPDATYRAEALAAGVRAEGINEIWQSDLVDPGGEVWRDFVVGRLAPAILAKDFDGFFLDTAESVELLAVQFPQRAEALRSGLVSLIKRLRADFPEAEIVVNRGFSVLPELYGTVDGVLCESLFRSYDYGNGEFSAVSESDVAWLMGHLSPAKEAGLAVYIIDFLPLTAREQADATVRRIRSLGFVPLISEPDLMGGIVAPLPVERRQVLCLYGGISAEEQISWAEDTDAMSHFQLPLEYLGFEVSYVDYEKEGLPGIPPPETGVILLDSSLSVAGVAQGALVDWLLACRARGVKIIFVGSLPTLVAEQRDRLREGLGIEGSLTGIGGVVEAAITRMDPAVMEFETAVRPRRDGTAEVRAGEGASVFLAVELAVRGGDPVEVHPVFAADWGGAVLYPYLAALNPEQNSMLQFDPFAFLQRALGEPSWPVPETTTHQGRRIYFSHIDGDGFLNFSEIAPGKRSGLVVQERIVEHYGLPVSISFIESEINGDSTVYEEREGESFVGEARRVFAHPLVEPASHTYSHPFFWSGQDPTSAAYDRQNVTLRTSYSDQPVSFEREIAGSIRYMNEVLGVPEKPAELILWSGNCRLPPEALQVAAEAGILNMNGGNTVISDRAPFLSLASPKAVRWGGQTQVYAPVQNENNFNNTFGNNRFGGYANVVETFRLTESPRRLKPLNVYYHFYSADRFDSFTALRRVMDYCAGQPSHPLWASEYVRIVLDTLETSVYRIGPNGWRIVGGGVCQTIRLPVAAGFPDLEKSVGILGFADAGGQRYFHTDGRPVVDLILTKMPPTRPHLRSAGATVENFQAERAAVALHTFNRAQRELAVELAGMGAGVRWQVESGGVVREQRADASGVLVLEAPSGRMEWHLRKN